MSCRVPPGRQYAVDNYFPQIPEPLYRRWAQRPADPGNWPGGIKKNLRDTAECHVNTHARIGPNGPLVELRPHVHGFFPWGWYKVPRPEAGPHPERRAPDPELAVDFYADGVSFDQPAFSDLPLAGCQRQDVPTIDLAIPWPLTDGNVYVPKLGRVVQLHVGEMGRTIVRVPGTDHPLYATGVGIWFLSHDFFTPEWRELAGGSLGIERCWLTTLFGEGTPGGRMGVHGNPPIHLAWYTRALAASHMQCPAPTWGPEWTSDDRIASLAGTPRPWRWRHGGDGPAPGVGEGWDTFEVAYHPANPNGWSSVMVYHSHNARDGSSLLVPNPDGRAVLVEGPETIGRRDDWTGPAPGTFLESYEADVGEDLPRLDPSGGMTLPTLRGLGAGTLSAHVTRTPNLGGFLSDVGDFFDDFDDVAEDVVSGVLEGAGHLVEEAWDELPGEVRQIARVVGPMAAQFYLPGFGGTLSEAALSIIDGRRNADQARDAIRAAAASGQLPVAIDTENAQHLAALVHAGQQFPSSASVPAGDGSPVGAAATAGGMLAALWLL